jgi:tetratricopeptide (TPR) repeat protein
MKKKKVKARSSRKKVYKQKIQSKQKTKNNNLDLIIQLGLIILIGIIIYSNSFDCSFQLDDQNSIIANKAIRDITDLGAIWDYSHSRFIAYYTFAVNYHFGALNVQGYHLVNLIIHLINSLLIYCLALLIFSSPAVKKYTFIKEKRMIAFITALFFVSHPLATQSVTYIVQRMASLVTLFYLFSLCTYILARLSKKSKSMKYGLYAATIVSAILALYTKQNAFTLPFAIILIEICFLQRKRLSINLKDYRIIFILAAIAGTTLFVLSNYSLTTLLNPQSPNAQNNFTTITPQNYLFTQFSVITKYIQLLFLPISQNLDYDFRVSNSLLDIRTIINLLLHISLVIFALFQFKKNRIITFGIFWFFLTLSIESSIIPISDVIFEHRTYLPSFGFFIILSSGIYLLLWHKYKYLAIALLVIIIGGNSLLTYERNKIWKTELSLWNDVISKSPNKARSYYNRGLAYQKNGQLDLAISDFSKAIDLSPAYYQAYINRSTLFTMQNQFNKAISDCDVAMKLNPNNSLALNNLGLVYDKLGQYKRAIEYYSNAININSEFSDAYSNRGISYGNLGRWEEALADFSRAIEINPNFNAAISNRQIAISKLNQKRGG